MKVLTAVAHPQNPRETDFCFAEDGEIVVLNASMVCDNPACGCDRTAMGVKSRKGTTTLRVSDLDQAGEHRQSASLNLAAFVITTDRDGTPRASVALDLAGRVMAILSLRRWANEKDGWPGIPEHEQRVIDPATVEATNLYAADIDTQGVALWAVSWQQTFTLTPPTPPEA